MSDAEIYRALNEIFAEVFEDDSIAVTAETTADDVAGWDSLTHVTLVVAIEQRFGVKFRTSEIEGLKNVGEMVQLISSKLHGAGMRV